MSFRTGRVTFARFIVRGDAPRIADDTVFKILASHAFRESSFVSPDQIEAGFITGQHLFDTDFTYEKCGFGEAPGDVLLFGLRIDTHKVPADVRQAYRQMEQSAMAAGNPSGFASKSQKRDAADHAERRLRDDLSAGKYRSSKAVPLMWDLSAGHIYCGATSNAAAEQLIKLIHTAFAVELEPLSAGELAEQLLSKKGRARDFEDLQPSAFTEPPPEAHRDHEDADGPGDVNTPSPPWTASGTNTRDFLGNELLLWLWHRLEEEEGVTPIHAAGPHATGGGPTHDIAVVIDRALDMDCAWGFRGRQTLRCDKPTQTPEAAEALRTGRWPRKAGLIVADVAEAAQWELSLQADRFIIHSAALPKVEDAESPRQIVEYRVALIRVLASTLDGLFKAFLDERLDANWPTKRDTIREWITRRRKRR